ncbi:MAG: hypothetical protein AAF790_15380 [Planctomycetota bacterium]
MTPNPAPRATSRRQFLASSAAGAAGAAAAIAASPTLGGRPAAPVGSTGPMAETGPVVKTVSKTGAGPVTVGEGEHTYLVDHNWLQLPDRYTWQTTHNIAVDKSGNVYVIHEGNPQKKDHPSIFVFDADGRFIRAFGSQFQGGGHGIEVREEAGEEFLYIAGYLSVKALSKLTLTGDVVWHHRAPMQSGRYAEGENTITQSKWGRRHFNPTNFAFLEADDPGGEALLVADGYGAFCIHRYSRAGEWQSAFGEPGKADGQFNTPHGLWIDRRGGGAPKVAVADRANGRLQWFTLDGEHLMTQGGFLLPANIDTRGDVMLVPDLQARVTLLGADNQVIAQLGEDQPWREQVLADGFKLRSQPEKWRDGRFLHPHDACFDADGNILVAEWVAGGRVSKLSRVDA